MKNEYSATIVEKSLKIEPYDVFEIKSLVRTKVIVTYITVLCLIIMISFLEKY